MKLLNLKFFLFYNENFKCFHYLLLFMSFRFNKMNSKAALSKKYGDHKITQMEQTIVIRYTYPI